MQIFVVSFIRPIHKLWHMLIEKSCNLPDVKKTKQTNKQTKLNGDYDPLKRTTYNLQSLCWQNVLNIALIIVDTAEGTKTFLFILSIHFLLNAEFVGNLVKRDPLYTFPSTAAPCCTLNHDFEKKNQSLANIKTVWKLRGFPKLGWYDITLWISPTSKWRTGRKVMLTWSKKQSDICLV